MSRISEPVRNALMTSGYVILYVSEIKFFSHLGRLVQYTGCRATNPKDSEFYECARAASHLKYFKLAVSLLYHRPRFGGHKHRFNLKRSED